MSLCHTLFWTWFLWGFYHTSRDLRPSINNFFLLGISIGQICLYFILSMLLKSATIQMNPSDQNIMFQSQDLSESLTRELMTTKKKLLETEEEKQRLETESAQVREMWHLLSITCFRNLPFLLWKMAQSYNIYMPPVVWHIAISPSVSPAFCFLEVFTQRFQILSWFLVCESTCITYG